MGFGVKVKGLGFGVKVKGLGFSAGAVRGGREGPTRTIRIVTRIAGIMSLYNARARPEGSLLLTSHARKPCGMAECARAESIRNRADEEQLWLLREEGKDRSERIAAQEEENETGANHDTG